jgi:hypothetical protein
MLFFAIMTDDLKPELNQSQGSQHSTMREPRYVFTASRWTAHNHVFPIRIEVTPERVSRVKPRLLGSDEESISVSQVASVSIRTGLIWATIQIDSTGGTDPIVSHGHRKEDARRIRDLIEYFQQGRGAPPGNAP